MNTLCRHIEHLLVEHNCVIVPNLGGFVAHECSAQYVEEEHLFLPPYRSVSFNQLLQHNDGLLTEAYMKSLGVSYIEALRCIENTVQDLKKDLTTGAQIELHGLGTLAAGEQGAYEFTPLCGGLVAPQFYALDSFSVNLCATKKKSSISVFPNRSVVRKLRYGSTLRWGSRAMRYIAAVIVLLLCFVWATPLNQNHLDNLHEASVISTLFAPLPSSVSSTSVASIPLVEPHTVSSRKVTPKQVEQTSPESAWTIVLASRVSKEGAQDLVDTMKKAGFSSARIHKGRKIRRVVYATYSSKEKGQEALRQLRQQDERFGQAWVTEL